MAEEVEVNETVEEVDIDKIVAEKMLEKEKEIKASLEEKYKRDLAKAEEGLVRQMEDIALETEPKKENSNTDGIEEFANKIKEKREKEKNAKEKAERELEYNAIKEENRVYKLKEQLAQIKKDEPYLAETIDEYVAEGSITNIKELDLIFNNSLKKRLKTSYDNEEMIKRAGGDPRAYLRNAGVVGDTVAKEEKRQQRVAEKKAKYRRK